MDTVLELLASQARTRGSAPAILATHQPQLAYRALYECVEVAGASLAGMGLGRGNRIALALGNGPDTAVATLVAMSWSACAPLNPSLGKDAGAAILSQLRIDALIAAEGDESPLVAAARALRLIVVRLRRLAQDAAGTFVLRSESTRAAAIASSAPRSDDLALVMQTSGTTSKAKIVPLSHAQILASARQVGLVADDRVLSVRPLFTKGALGIDLFAPACCRCEHRDNAGIRRVGFRRTGSTNSGRRSIQPAPQYTPQSWKRSSNASPRLRARCVTFGRAARRCRRPFNAASRRRWACRSSRGMA